MSLSITSSDLALVSQNIQHRLVMLRVVNRSLKNVCSIRGQLISGNINIDESSNVRRSADVSLRIGKESMDNLIHLSTDNFVRLYIGIEDNKTGNPTWYLQGTFIIDQNSLAFDAVTRTLSLNLSDLMIDLTGDRRGVLYAFSSIVKNSQRISDVMVNVLALCGFDIYDITPIRVYRKASNFWDEKETEQDYMVPYDLEFNVGVTAYGILEKLINLYPGWEMFFDLNGVFVCHRMVTEEDKSFVILDDDQLKNVVIRENTAVDYSKVKNVIEVWGKEGNYYGEAQDENPESPFQVSSIGEMKMVVHYDQIYDRYKSPEKLKEINIEISKTKEEISTLADTILKKQSEGADTSDLKKEFNSAKYSLSTLENQKTFQIDVRGDDMAKEWAEQLLYENCRTQDSITLECVSLPFLNDINFKISYRNKLDNKVRTYMVKSISHNLDGNTTTINAVRFYNEQSSAYQDQLEQPIILSHNLSEREITVQVQPVSHTEKYILYLDFKPVASSTGTTLSYTIPDFVEGEHIISVGVEAEGYRDSEYSESITVSLSE